MKHLSLLLAAGALALLAPACKQQTPAPAKKTVGVTLLTRAHLFYRDLEEGLRSEAQKDGIELIVTAAEFDLGKQVGHIEDFIARKVDAILVCPADSRGIGAGIARANAAGIPVFTADIAASEGSVISHIASDNKAGGQLAGEYIARLLNGKGTVAIINQPAITSVLDRVEGFREAIAKHSGITVVADVNGEGVRDKAMQAASDVLQAHPKLNALFGINDDSALGALDAARQFQRNALIIVGYDATPPAVDAILRGSQLKADVVQNPKLIGTTAIQTIAKHLAGEQVPSVIPVAVDIADAESLKKGMR